MPDSPIAPPQVCPACGGARLTPHPAGELVFQHSLSCTVGNADYATRAADAERAFSAGGEFTRPTTATELALAGLSSVARPWVTSVEPVVWSSVLHREIRPAEE